MPSLSRRGSRAPYSPSLLARSCSTVLMSPPDSYIFERSVQEFGVSDIDPMQSPLTPPHFHKVGVTRVRGLSVCVANFLQFRLKNEDQTAPTLDATTELLNDQSADLNTVEIIYSPRRNSSVLGLNMALGRPPLGLRLRSGFLLPMLNAMLTTHGQLPSDEAASNPAHETPSQPQSPTSPLRTFLQLSFYSYADMIDNDEFARRLSIRSASSSSAGFPFDPPNKPPFAAPVAGKIRPKVNIMRASVAPDSPSLDALVQPHIASHPLSPDLLDNEECKRLHTRLDIDPTLTLSRRQSINSAFLARNSLPLVPNPDEETFVSASMADCIRQSTCEIISRR